MPIDELEQRVDFFVAAFDACKRRGKVYAFVCPNCGGLALVYRRKIIGRYTAACLECEMEYKEKFGKTLLLTKKSFRKTSGGDAT